MLAAILATVIFEGPLFEDGRREVILALETPWSFFVDFDEPAEPAVYPPLLNARFPE